MLHQLRDLTIGQQINGGIVADQRGLGDAGIMVTTHNLAQATDWQSANNLAENCTDGGYNDWRLPSWDELHRIYSNLYRNNLGGFPQGEYWSSTPGYGPGVHRAQTFSSRDQSLLWVDGMPNHVRAVRTIPWEIPTMANLVEISNDLFENAEKTYLRHDGLNYLSVDTDGVIRANANRTNAVPIITEVVRRKLYLKMGERYLVSYDSGQFKAVKTARKNASTFKFYSSPDNSVVIKTDAGLTVIANSSGALDTVSASYYNSTMRFDINLKPMIDPHRIMHTMSVMTPCDAAFASLLWKVTGGLILGMGVGPYLNGGRAEAGVFALLNSRPAGRAAMEGLERAARDNPKMTASVVCTFFAKLHSAGMLMDLVWFLLSIAKWITAGTFIRRAIMWAFVPEVEAAEFFTNLTIWTAQTTQAIFAYRTACAKAPKGVFHPKLTGKANAGSINIYRKLANKGDTRVIDGLGTPSLGRGWNDTIKSFYINKGRWIFYKNENYTGEIWGPFDHGPWGGAGTTSQFDPGLVETTALRCIPDTGITLFTEPDLHGTMIHLDGDKEIDLTDQKINFTGLNGSYSAPDANWHLVVKLAKSNSPFAGPATEFGIELTKNRYYRNLRDLIPSSGASLLRLKRV